MNIGIVPKIISVYKTQLEISVDYNLIKFLKLVFKKTKISILNQTLLNQDLDLIVLHGGNDLKKLSSKKEDIEREKFNEYFFKISMRKNIPILGICLGAQFIAQKFKGKIIRKRQVGDHRIYFVQNSFTDKMSKPKKVNSYHDFCIRSIKGNFTHLAFCESNNIECFLNFQKKTMGIMWHPERYKRFRKFDVKLIKKFYDFSNSSSRTR